MEHSDLVVIGGGIVGLCTAREFLRRRPGSAVTLLEKESRLALHQTGRNSGVLHTGVYYRPGSAKARSCTAGRLAMLEYCREHAIPHELCGKVIVATREEELPRLQALHDRAMANGIECDSIGPARLRELEPHVQGLAALHLPGAGIVDYRRVARSLGEEITALGGRVVTGCRVSGISKEGAGVLVRATSGDFSAVRAVNCAGLHSDRLMRTTGESPPVQIVPFRGEYYLLSETARGLCRNLIYPVPDPSFPFLGVHFTRAVDGEVEAGPNAVLAFAREGYRLWNVDPRDLLETLAHRGFRRLAAKHWRMGCGEIWRSIHKAAFVRALQRLVPEIQATDLSPAPAGVRAQAITDLGELVDDFRLEQRGPVTHVCNAPSPAATSSLAIGATVVDMALGGRAPGSSAATPAGVGRA